MIYNLIYFLSFLATLILTLVVYLSNRRNTINRTFTLLLINIIGWIITLFLFYTIHVPSFVLLIGRANFAFAVLISTTLFVFSYYFPVATFKLPGWTKTLIFLETLALTAITVFTPLVDQSEIIEEHGRLTIYGPLYYLFIVHFFIYSATSLLALYLKRKKISGRERLQLRYLSFGIISAIIFGTTTNIFIPLFTGNYDVQNFGVIAPVFLAVFTAYSIAKHRLMDIRLIILRLVVYTLLIFTLGFFYSLSIIVIGGVLFPQTFSVGYIAFTVSIALFGVFTFQPLRQYFENITAKFLYKDYYDSNELLRELSHKMAAVLNIDLLSKEVINTLKKYMHITEISIAVMDDNTLGLYGDTRGLSKYDLNIEELRFVQKNESNIVVFDEMKESSVKESLRKYDIEIALPIKTADKFLGFLFLGQRSSGDIYYEQDIRTLEILGPELAVAIQNAQRYEEIKQFSKKLEKEVQEATSELRDANEKLTALDKQKNEFISVAAHELRAPLTAVKGYLSMIAEGDAGKINEKIGEFVSDASLSSERMVRLIGNLLNVGRIEEGRLVYQMGNINLSEVATSVYKEFGQEAKLKDLDLKLDISENISDLVYVDRDRIHEVIGNFVGNGIKYTEKGLVTIKLTNPDTDVVRLEVIDTGPGIPKKEQGNLFQKYFRVKSTATAVSGTGLGLYVSRLLIEKFNGKIGVDSIEEKGSNFWFEIPLTKNK